MAVQPLRYRESPAQKAARRKHGKRALEALLNAAARMEKAHLPLVTITGAIGEAWAVAELAMQPTANAAAPYDGWLPDGTKVEVKCRYAPRGGSSIVLNPGKSEPSVQERRVDLLVAVEVSAEKDVREVYVGPYKSAIELGSRLKNGMIQVRWADLANSSQSHSTADARP